MCVGAMGRSEMDFALSEVAVRYGQIIAGLVQQRRMITGFIVSRRHNQPYLMSLIQHTHCHLIYGVRWLSLPRSGFIMATILLEFSLLYAFFLFSISRVHCISHCFSVSVVSHSHKSDADVCTSLLDTGSCTRPDLI